MGKNNKKRRAEKKRKANKARSRVNTKASPQIAPVLSEISNPFKGMTDEDKEALLTKIATEGTEKVVECFEHLTNVVKEYEPLNLLSMLACYGLTVFISEDGVESTESSGGLQQAHVELLQALVLSVPSDELGAKPVTPDVVQDLFDSLLQLNSSYSASRMKLAKQGATSAEQAVELVQELARGHTQMVRNWGYHSQQNTIPKELYGCFDELLEKNVGFSATNAIDVFNALSRTVEQRLSERMASLSSLRNTKGNYELLLKYHELIGQGREEADEFAAKFGLSKISKKNLFIMLVSHFDLRTLENYLIDKSSLSTLLGIDLEVVENLLEYFSRKFGDLEGREREHFFLDNPIWLKPIISKGTEYYCVLPQLFFSYVLDALDDLVEQFDKDALHDRRAVYLESKIESIVKTRFPDSHVVAGVKWVFNGAEYETDLVAFIDSHAIIFEAKSHKISAPALRGAPKRIKRHLEEVFIEPAVQSYRFEQKINELMMGGADDDQLLSRVPVDIGDIKKVLRVSVSLEDFATLQTNLELIKDTGWLPQDFTPCPTINLADLETLFDFLEHPVQIIHYLSRRTELFGKYNVFGDELDYMGLYATTLLNMGNLDKAGGMIALTNMSNPLDRYYISRDQGVHIDKPQPAISTWFKEIFDALEERATPRWTEIGCILNRFAPDNQVDISKGIKTLARRVQKHWKTDGHENTLIFRPPASSEYALAVVLYKNENSERRHDFFENAAVLGLEPEHVQYCLVIGLNIDANDLPYHYIALAEPPK